MMMLIDQHCNETFCWKFYRLKMLFGCRRWSPVHSVNHSLFLYRLVRVRRYDRYWNKNTHMISQFSMCTMTSMGNFCSAISPSPARARAIVIDSTSRTLDANSSTTCKCTEEGQHFTVLGVPTCAIHNGLEYFCWLFQELKLSELWIVLDAGRDWWPAQPRHYPLSWGMR